MFPKEKVSWVQPPEQFSHLSFRTLAVLFPVLAHGHFDISGHWPRTAESSSDHGACIIVFVQDYFF